MRKIVATGIALLFLVGWSGGTAETRGAHALAADAGSETPPGDLQRDRRLLAKVDLVEKDRPLRDLLPALGNRLGIRLKVSRTLADDKLTVLVKQHPARDLMQHLAEQVEGEWRPSGSGYLLARSEAGRLRQERLRAEEWKAVAGWMKRLDRLQETPGEQLNARRQEVERVLAVGTVTGPRKLALEEERDLLRDHFRHSRAVPVAVDLFRSLSPGQLSQLRREGYLRLSSTHGSIPPSFFTRAVAALPGHASGERKPKPVHVDTTFELEERAIDRERLNSPRVLRLSVNLTSMWETVPGGYSSSSLNWAARVPSPSLGPEGDRKGESPILDRPLELTFAPLVPVPEVERYGAAVVLLREVPAGWVRLSEVLSRLHAATGLPFVADSYTRARVERKQLMGRKSPRELLNELSEPLGYTWTADGAVVRLWSRYAAQDREGEAPEPALRAYRRRVEGEPLARLDALATLANTLTDRQCRNVADLWGWYFEGLGAIPPWNGEGIYGVRHHLRLWSTLSRAQRQAALAGVLPMEGMTPPQRRALGVATAAPGSDITLQDHLRIPTPERLAPLSAGFQLKSEDLLAQALTDENGCFTTAFHKADSPLNLFNLTRFGGGSLKVTGPAAPVNGFRFSYFLSGAPDNGFVRSVQVHLLPRWSP